MNLFKKIDDNKFFVCIDAPLYNKQCMKLQTMLPDYVVYVTHDHYGSFIVELEDGVEQTDELYGDIWEAGLDLFAALHQSQIFQEFLSESEDVSEAWEWATGILESCEYEYTEIEIAEILVDCGFDQLEVDHYLTMATLAKEAA